MKIWKYSKLDSILAILSILQFILFLVIATHWHSFNDLERLGAFLLQTLFMTYNIIVISHLFTHAQWFNSSLLNQLFSMLNTINIGQSVKCYHLSHVRNHHRYNNDAKNADGLTMDSSSTYLEGENGEHASLSRYAFHGAIVTIINIGRLLLTAWLRFWRVSDAEKSILNLLATSADRRKSELLQIQLDRIALFFGLVLFLSISWQWTLFCLIPAFYLALALVNIQNYYEHYGANPNDLLANSVSYYGRLYNWLSFNDGYHQEHHLSFGAHWQQMPTVKATKLDNAENVERIISPVPAIIGYFDRNRKLLHKLSPTQPITNNVIEEIPG